MNHILDFLSMQLACHMSYYLTAEALGLSLTVFLLPLLQCSLNLRCRRGCVVDVPIWIGYPTVNCSLHLDQLWISIIISLF